jgi:hypothetical protein
LDYNRFIKKLQMKRHLFSLVLVAGAIIFTGCQSGPRVIAELTDHYPARLADSVMVYEPGDQVPAEAKVIGTVKVTDGVMTPAYKCLYSNMLTLAVRKTAESGGNALRIDQHKEPSMWKSGCHRIWGSMLLLPDSLVNIDAVSAIQKAELNKDTELANMTRDQISRFERATNNPKNIFNANFGYGTVTSRSLQAGMNTKTKAASRQIFPISTSGLCLVLELISTIFIPRLMKVLI